AHVDHGKTTLVDCLLKQSGTFRANQAQQSEERIMDSMDLEREKGITIKAKNAAFKYHNYHINIVDTPGHADFGGEVERIMNMIDSMTPLFEAIIKHIPPPRAYAGVEFKMLVANLDYSDYLGRIAFGKIVSGKVKLADPAACIHGDGRRSASKITAIFHFEGLKRIEVPEAHAGDIVGVTGFEDVFIGETITDTVDRQPLPFVPID